MLNVQARRSQPLQEETAAEIGRGYVETCRTLDVNVRRLDFPRHLQRLHYYRLESGHFSAEQLTQPRYFDAANIGQARVTLASPHLLEFITSPGSNDLSLAQLAHGYSLGLSFRPSRTDGYILVDPQAYVDETVSEVRIVTPQLGGRLIKRIEHLVTKQNPTVTALMAVCLPFRSEPLVGVPSHGAIGLNLYGRVQFDGTTSTFAKAFITPVSRNAPGPGHAQGLHEALRTHLSGYVEKCAERYHSQGSLLWEPEIQLPQ